MTSIPKICNVALRRIASQPIAELLEDTEEARACNDLYASSRDALLQRFPWPFATRRVFLSKIDEIDEDTDLRKESWAFSYALPSDCLVARQLWPGARSAYVNQRIPFTTEHDAAGQRQVLYCDLDSASSPVELLYLARVENPVLFSPLFADALSWLLAAELALCLVDRASSEAKCRARYEEAFDRASVAAQREGVEFRPDSPTIASRGWR